MGRLKIGTLSEIGMDSNVWDMVKMLSEHFPLRMLYQDRGIRSRMGTSEPSRETRDKEKEEVNTLLATGGKDVVLCP